MCATALDEFASTDRSGLDAARLLANLDGLVELSKRSGSLAAALSEEVRRRGAAAKTEGVDVESHLRMKHRLSPAEIRKLVKQGEVLRPFEVMSLATQRGEISPAQAEACARELADFPVDILGDAALREAETLLVAEARRLGARQLGLKARRLVDQARQEAGVGGDRADRLDRDHEKAFKERFLSFKRDGQTMIIRGRCTIEAGLRIKARLESAALAVRRARTDSTNGAPNGEAQGRHDPADEGAGSGSFGPLAGGSASNNSQDAVSSGRREDPATGGEDGNVWDPATGGGAGGASWDPLAGGGLEAEPFAASVMDALEAIMDYDPGVEAPLQVGKPARFVVTMTEEGLRSGALEGTLQESGEPLAPSALDQAACDSEWIAVLRGSFGQPLDVGRATRRVPKALRIALEERDNGCVFPGCGVSASGCQAHHLHKWVLGGSTSLDNLALCCAVHHKIVEPARKLPDGTPWRPGADDPGRWRIEIDPVHHHPVVIPPARVDPERKPLLNGRIRLKLEMLGALPQSAQGSSGPAAAPEGEIHRAQGNGFRERQQAVQ
ncbi:MAG: DUF222 domain-containing protein [Bifidobacteriaceae bacterium]|jgi:hypothetical protein|nr:DUF222 domain-containing protein [Bifidobacteriaceae bacterium]